MKQSLWLHGCGLGIALLSAGLAYFSWMIDPTGNTGQIVVLLGLLGCMALLYALVVWGVISGRLKASLGGVLFWALVFRFILFPSRPILETDFYRYLWDGYVLSQGYDPYQFSPQEVLDDTPVDGLSQQATESLEQLRELVRKNSQAQEVLSSVNNPQVITIYPPFGQIVFAGVSTFAPLSMTGWRAAILLFDGVLIVVLVFLLPRFGREASWVLIYAWSPLVLKETVNTLHFDVIATSVLFLGILFSLARYSLRAPLALACGVMTKGYPLLVAPFWLRGLKWWTWVVFGAVMLLLLFVFSGSGERGASGWATFAYRWESNSSLVAAMEAVLVKCGVPAWGEGRELVTLAGTTFRLDAFLAAKGIGVLVVLAVAMIFYGNIFRRNSVNEESLLWRSFVLVGVVLLCSPVCNPWYVTWMVPFLCFYPRMAWLYFSIACLVHYTFFIPDPWGYLPYAREAEYIPFFGLLVWQWWKERRKNRLEFESEAKSI